MRIQPKPREMNSCVDKLQKLYQQMLQSDNANSKAIFFDRDGTINEERGYLKDSKLVTLLPTASSALISLEDLGFLIIIITNQSAIGRGLIEYEEFFAVNTEVWKQLQQSGARYHGLYYCPHNPDAVVCECRKPNSGLLFQAAVDFGINLQESYLVGDKISDLEAGQNAGCKTVLCRTGFGKKTEEALDKNKVYPDFIGNHLLEIARWISTDSKNK